MDIDKELREFRGETEGEEVVQTPAPETPAAPPEKLRVASLDDIILDDPKLPPELRGKPASALLQDRTEGWRRAHEGGFLKNRLEAERDTALAALDRTLAKIAPQAEPERPARPSDRVRQRGFDPATQTISNPDAAFDNTVEIGAEEAESRLRPEIESASQRIERLEKDAEERKVADRNQRLQTAFQSARPENVSPEDWNEFSWEASAYVFKHNADPEKADTYKTAWSTYIQNAQRRVGQPAAPAVVPAAPAPPVGGGKPAVPQQGKSTAHLNNHQRSAAAKIVGIFAKHGLTASADDIMDDVRQDPKTRSAFP